MTVSKFNKVSCFPDSRLSLRLHLPFTCSYTLLSVEDNTISGGVTINDVLMHAGVPGAPFGGVGESGMGYYHGKYGFLAFSHTRTIVAPPTWLDRLMSFRYPPFDIRHRGKLAVPNRLGFKRGEKLEDQKIKAWPPRRMATWLTVALVIAGIAVLLDHRTGDVLLWKNSVHETL
jgi:aldehyde dehydrogenase (NAD+)